MGMVTISIHTLYSLALYFSEGKAFVFVTASFYFKEGSTGFHSIIKSED